jgi:glycosyltransferase involved in cell wall biosynthesis
MIALRVIELNSLVSVVIPTKNSSKTLESCIQSIQKQSYPNIETIIVDSKSNDDTLNISNSLGCKQVISTNWKLLGARYEGLKVATGDYILMLDSDQILETSAIERCIVFAQRYDMLCLEEMSYKPRTFVEKLNQADRQLIHHEYDVQKHPLYGTLLARFYRRDILEKTFKHIPVVLFPLVVFYDHAIIYYEAWKVSSNVGIVPNAVWHNEPTTIIELWRKNFRYGKSTKMLLKSKHYNDLVKNKVRLRKTNSRELSKYKFLSSLLLLLKAPAYLSGLYF